MASRRSDDSAVDVIRLRAALVGMLNATDAYMDEYEDRRFVCDKDPYAEGACLHPPLSCVGPPPVGTCPHGTGRWIYQPRRAALNEARQLATDVALMYDEDGGRRA